MDYNEQDHEKRLKTPEETVEGGGMDIEKASQLEATQADTVEEPLAEEKVAYRYAGFWMRFWAYLLDLVVIASINGIIVYPILRALDLRISDPSMFAPVSIASAVIFYGYFVLMTKFLGQTLGKMVFGLKVISIENENLNWSTVMFREWIGRFISGSILILYIVVAFLPKRQGIHDLFADTTVIHER